MASGYVYPSAQEGTTSTVAWRPQYLPVILHRNSDDYSTDDFDFDQLRTDRSNSNVNDDERSLDSFEGATTTGIQSVARHSPVSDDDLVKIPVRELNQRLQGFDRQVITALKQKRRTLKNRGYAYKCRVRRLQVQLQLESENAMLKAEVCKLRQKLNESNQVKNELYTLRNEVARLHGEMYVEKREDQLQVYCGEQVGEMQCFDACNKRNSHVDISPCYSDSMVDERDAYDAGPWSSAAHAHPTDLSHDSLLD